MVWSKQLNTRKHRHGKQATRGWIRLGPKWQAVRFGLSNVARRERCTAGVQSGPNPSCGRCGTWKSRFSSSRLGCSKAGQPQARPRGDGMQRIEKAKAVL